MLWLVSIMVLTQATNGFQCTACAKGTVMLKECSTSADTVCMACPAGFYSDDGVGCYISPAGSFSLQGATNYTLCANGTFNENTAASSCQPCSVCADSSKASATCTATTDTYCSDCVPCEPNTFMTGLLANTPQCSPCTQCGPDTYVISYCNGITDTICGKYTNTTHERTEIPTNTQHTTVARIQHTTVANTTHERTHMTTMSYPNSLDILVSIIPTAGILMLLCICIYTCTPQTIRRKQILHIQI